MFNLLSQINLATCYLWPLILASYSTTSGLDSVCSILRRSNMFVFTLNNFVQIIHNFLNRHILKKLHRNMDVNQRCLHYNKLQECRGKAFHEYSLFSKHFFSSTCHNCPHFLIWIQKTSLHPGSGGTKKLKDLTSSAGNRVWDLL